MGNLLINLTAIISSWWIILIFTFKNVMDGFNVITSTAWINIFFRNQQSMIYE